MAEKQNLSPWFNTRTDPPARPGVYERAVKSAGSSGQWFAHWDGERWRCGWHDARGAFHVRDTGWSLNQGGDWRGVLRASTKENGNG